MKKELQQPFTSLQTLHMTKEEENFFSTSEEVRGGGRGSKKPPNAHLSLSC